MAIYGESITQKMRLRIAAALFLTAFCLLAARLVYLQVIRHEFYLDQASHEHTQKYEIEPSRGELFVNDGSDQISAIAMNQTLNVLSADPKYVTDKAGEARKLAAITGGSAADYQSKLEHGIEYAVLAKRVPNDVADRIRRLRLPGIGVAAGEYRVYPEGELAAQMLGFVNSDGVGQYGIEQYLNDALTGVPGQLAAKTDTNGLPVATADNVIKRPVDGKSYLLSIDRNIQAFVEQEIAKQVKSSKAKSGSVIVMDPNTGAVLAMATWPGYDPNGYGQVKDYGLFENQAVSSEFEPGSGVKTFTMATGLDQGKITPDSTYDDPGCVLVSGHNVCNAAGDHAGKGKSMTVVLRDSLNTGVMFVLRMLGGDLTKFNLAGKQALYGYFTQHFGFGSLTGIEQADEVSGRINPPSNAPGNDLTYANMTFGQGMSVTMIQMADAMAAVANGGRLYQPSLVEAEIMPDGTRRAVAPKVARDNVISKQAAAGLTKMLTVVVEHGSGYKARIPGYAGQIAGKTGTAQIPKPDGSGYIDGANIGSFTGFAPVSKPKFVLMVRITEPQIDGYAEVTTVPAFRDICDWLFKYYGIAPSGQ